MPNVSPKPLRDAPLTILAVLFMVIATLSLARAVLIPVALAILLSFILMPVVMYLQKRGVPRNLAVTLVSVVAFLGLAMMLFLISLEMRSLAGEIPDRREEIRTKIDSIKGSESTLLGELVRMVEDLGKEFDAPAPEDVGVTPVKIVDTKPSGLSIVSVVAEPTINLLASAGLVIALTLGMLIKREDLRNRVLRLVGHGELASTTQAMDEAARLLSRYLLMAVCLNASFGLVFGLGLALIGVDYAFLWGVLAFMFRFVPYIGTWLAGIFPLITAIATSQGHEWVQPILVVVWLLVLGLGVNSLIEPLLVSRSTGISPIALIIATAFWTWLWGPIGLVLATPMTVCLIVLGRYVAGLRFFDVLLGTKPALAPQHTFYQRLLAQDEDEATELAEDFLETHDLPTLCDEVLVPALVHARVDHQSGDLNDDGLASVAELARGVFDELIEDLDQPEHPSILACPMRGPLDRAALRLLGASLGEQGRLRIPEDVTDSRGLIRLLDEKPEKSICLVTLAPGGQAKVRQLCRRLRGRFPEMRIIVAFLGVSHEGAAELTEPFRKLGATVVTSITQARILLTEADSDTLAESP